VADDDEQAILIAKKLLSFLPQNNTEDAPIVDPDDPTWSTTALRDIVPTEGNKGYDVREVIGEIVDHADFLEVQAGYARTSWSASAASTAAERSASSPTSRASMAGVLDINASDKASKFIRFCNAFNIPVVNLVDVPGFLPGVAQEHGGIIRHGAKMLYAYSAATVPKITVVLRKAYGGAYLAMCSKDLGADKVFAWPTAEIAVMGAEGAAAVVFRKEIDAAEDPDARAPSWSRSTATPSPRRSWPRPVAWSTTSSTRPTPVADRDGAGDPGQQARAAARQEARPRPGLIGGHHVDDVNAELLAAVGRSPSGSRASRPRSRAQAAERADVPEETMVAIAAAVAAYLGHRAKRRQAHFTRSASGSRPRPPSQHDRTIRCTCGDLKTHHEAEGDRQRHPYEIEVEVEEEEKPPSARS
jgi:hypothetical protein